MPRLLLVLLILQAGAHIHTHTAASNTGVGLALSAAEVGGSIMTLLVLVTCHITAAKARTTVALVVHVCSGHRSRPVTVVRGVTMTILWAVSPLTVIIIQPRCVSLPHSFAVHLVLLFFTHAVYLLFEKLHLLRIIISYLILLPLLVLAALLYALLEDVETAEVLHVLHLVINVGLTVIFTWTTEVVEGEIFETGTI